MSLSSFFIGPVEVKPLFILAPMSGVTSRSFRRLIHRENGNALGLTVTEFISVEALTRNNKRSLEMLDFRDEPRPISVQIFGYDLDRLQRAAELVEENGADILDLNCGCPVPKVVKRGGGCELMRQPEHLAKVLTTLKKTVKIPLTIKIRLGWDEKHKNALEIAKLAQGCGVDMLCLHGRTKVQLYSGEADRDIVNTLVKNLTIPIVANGDIVNLGSAQDYLSRGAQGLMIGRGALVNPWVFVDLQRQMSGQSPLAHSKQDVCRVVCDYSKFLLEEMPEKGALGRMKQLVGQATKGLRDSTKLRQLLCRSQSLEEMIDHLHRWSAAKESEENYVKS
ncbi:MAG: tRNA-dihydrouridine synthase [Deltaproteobacteria bacterium]|nr:tRNA-dihydrouridine synthase [Deltaproteobacteria bacterium]